MLKIRCHVFILKRNNLQNRLEIGENACHAIRVAQARPIRFETRAKTNNLII